INHPLVEFPPMRTLLTLALFIAAPTSVPAFQEKKDLPKNQQPIAVVKIDRKEPVTYEKDIEPIIINKCQYCHSANLKEGNLERGSFEGLTKGGKRGASIVPGKSAESLLIKLAGKTEKPLMPPKNDEPLAPEELALIKLWIDQGAKSTGERI